MDKFIKKAEKEAYEEAMAEYYGSKEAATEHFQENCSSYQAGICKGDCEQCYEKSTAADPYPVYTPRD